MQLLRADTEEENSNSTNLGVKVKSKRKFAILRKHINLGKYINMRHLKGNNKIKSVSAASPDIIKNICAQRNGDIKSEAAFK